MLEPERVAALCMEGAAIATVLDVGTGTGLFAEAFLTAGVSVTGVDVSLDLLAAARRHVPMAEFMEAGAEELPFEDGSFDLVFLGQVLHETDDPSRALAEARRVARVRVAVLEWPYRREESGPPLEHRLKETDIAALASAAGLHATAMLRMSHMDLYTFAPGAGIQ
jgi:ubiquinone/menaquinone biosynthesis C-methylase UbiE